MVVQIDPKDLVTPGEHFIVHSSSLYNKQMIRTYIFISCLFLGLAWYVTHDGSKVGKVAETENGRIKGVVLKSREKQEYYAWHRIPFAQPPVDDLRFADPKPPTNWHGVLDGSQYALACAQHPFFGQRIVGEEDCLYLNVFVPKKLYDTKDQSKTRHPVLVYIYGGAYISGSSDMLNPRYIMDEDIVVVSIAYRVHILGFLTTGDKVVRGNMGLKDQTLALKWVQKNIQHFGGDPNQVTIYGTSAGGASVHQQMLSPLSKGLFHKAFSQSGVASNSWGILTLERSLEKTREVANDFKCPSENSQQLVECLRKVKIEDLLGRDNSLWAEYFLLQPQLNGDGFEPIIEAVNDSETFLADHPLKIVATGKAHPVPWMVGVTTHEGLIAYKELNSNPEFMDILSATAGSRIQQMFQADAKSANKIWEFYFPSSQRKSMTREEKVEQYVEMFGDGFFNFDLRESVYYQRGFSPVYYYLHNKTDSGNWFLHSVLTDLELQGNIYLELPKVIFRSLVYGTLLGMDPPFLGIYHGLDAGYYGAFEGLDLEPGNKNYEYSRDLVRMLSVFMRDDTQMTFRGERFLPTPTKGPIKAFEFKNEHAEMVEEPFASRMQFLHSLRIRPVS